MQMILQNDRNNKAIGYDSMEENTGKMKTDGVPSIDNSSKKRGINSSKFLQNDEDEDDRLSNITEVFYEEDDKKFIRVYNMQGHYSSSQSVRSVFTRVSNIINKIFYSFVR